MENFVLSPDRAAEETEGYLRKIRKISKPTMQGAESERIMEFYDLVNSSAIQGNIEVWNLDEEDNQELVFSLDNVDDLGICFYPENFDDHCDVAFVYASDGKLVIEVRNAWYPDEDQHLVENLRIAPYMVGFDGKSMSSHGGFRGRNVMGAITGNIVSFADADGICMGSIRCAVGEIDDARRAALVEQMDMMGAEKIDVYGFGGNILATYDAGWKICPDAMFDGCIQGAGGKMSKNDLTPDELWLYMPRWKKILLMLFVAALPVVGSIETISIQSVRPENLSEGKIMRSYTVVFWIGDDHDQLEFSSDHRAGSKANREDAMSEIRRRRGKYICDRAEIAEVFGIYLNSQGGKDGR